MILWLSIDLVITIIVILLVYRILRSTLVGGRTKEVLRVLLTYVLLVFGTFTLSFSLEGYTLYGSLLYGSILTSVHLVLIGGVISVVLASKL